MKSHVKTSRWHFAFAVFLVSFGSLYFFKGLEAYRENTEISVEGGYMIGGGQAMIAGALFVFVGLYYFTTVLLKTMKESNQSSGKTSR